MKKYVYENATVYIDIPTEEQVRNIREATERFARRIAKKGLMKKHVNSRESDRRISRTTTDTR